MRRRRVAALWLCAVLPGLVAACVSGYYLLRDWAALIRAFSAFETAVRSGGDVRAVTVADAYQMTYRVNCFADAANASLPSRVIVSPSVPERWTSLCPSVYRS